MIEQLIEVHVAQLFAGGKNIAVAQQIFAPDGNRIEAQPLGDHIHLTLVGPDRLRHAEAAQRARRHEVGPNRVGVNVHMRNFIRPRHGRAAVARHHRADVAVGAGVKMRRHLARD